MMTTQDIWVLIIGGVLLYIVERPGLLLALLWVGFGLFITAGLGPLASLFVWAPMATFGVVIMMSWPKQARDRRVSDAGRAATRPAQQP